MTQLSFTTTDFWDAVCGFGCASLGLACNDERGQIKVQNYPQPLQGMVFTGTYSAVLKAVQAFSCLAMLAVKSGFLPNCSR